MTAPVNPTVGADSGVWGGELNAIFNAHQAKLKANYMGFYDNRRTATLDETTVTQYPDATMGPWGCVAGYDFVNSSPLTTMRAIVTDPRPFVYKSFHQINAGGNQFAGTGIANPEQDTFSWQHNCVVTQKSLDAAISAGLLAETAVLHSATPIASGNRITNANGYLCANLRDDGYTRYVAYSMINFARNYGFNHYFIDNMNDSVNSITGTACVEFADDYEGEFALMRGYRKIFTMLAEGGIRCIINSGGVLNNSTAGTPNKHTFENLGRGDAQIRFYNQILRYPAIIAPSEEFYMQVSAGEPLDDSIFTASANTGFASGTPANVTHPPGSFGSYRFRAHQFAHSLGKGHFGVVYGPNAPGPTGAARNLRLSHAIDLLLWDGISAGGMLVFANTSGVNTDTSPTYKWDVGYPRGPYRRLSTTSSGLYRDYVREDGTAVQVKVNLDFTNAVTINGTSVAAGDAVAV